MQSFRTLDSEMRNQTEPNIYTYKWVRVKFKRLDMFRFANHGIRFVVVELVINGGTLFGTFSDQGVPQVRIVRHSYAAHQYVYLVVFVKRWRGDGRMCDDRCRRYLFVARFGDVELIGRTEEVEFVITFIRRRRFQYDF